MHIIFIFRPLAKHLRNVPDKKFRATGAEDLKKMFNARENIWLIPFSYFYNHNHKHVSLFRVISAIILTNNSLHCNSECIFCKSLLHSRTKWKKELLNAIACCKKYVCVLPLCASCKWHEKLYKRLWRKCAMLHMKFIRYNKCNSTWKEKHNIYMYIHVHIYFFLY